MEKNLFRHRYTYTKQEIPGFYALTLVGERTAAAIGKEALKMASKKVENPQKAGRKTKYDDLVKPRLKEIEEWIKHGVPEYQVYANLGVGRNAWYTYKRDHTELKETVKRGTVPLVAAIRGALAQRALGMNYTEKKTYIKTDEKGKPIAYEEITEKFAPPDVAACNLMLKNLDKDNWANDPQYLEFKRLDLKHKQQLEKMNQFKPVSNEVEEDDK